MICVVASKVLDDSVNQCRLPKRDLVDAETLDTEENTSELAPHNVFRDPCISRSPPNQPTQSKIPIRARPPSSDKAQEKMQRRLLLNRVFSKRAALLERLTGVDEALIGDRDSRLGLRGW